MVIEADICWLLSGMANANLGCLPNGRKPDPRTKTYKPLRLLGSSPLSLFDEKKRFLRENKSDSTIMARRLILNAAENMSCAARTRRACHKRTSRADQAQ